MQKESWTFLTEPKVILILCKAAENPKARLTHPQQHTIALDVRKAQCISFNASSLTPLTASHLLGQRLKTKSSN